MRCQEIMKDDVACLAPTDSAEVAARTMRDLNVGFLPVCNRAGKPIGAITDRDLTVRLLAENGSPDTEISRLMTGTVIACRVEDDVQKAQALMAEHHKSRIMVVEGEGRIAGVISLSDIADRVGGLRAAQTLREVSQREVRAPYGF
jgi:CBS domain-containing protein